MSKQSTSGKRKHVRTLITPPKLGLISRLESGETAKEWLWFHITIDQLYIYKELGGTITIVYSNK